MGRRIGSLYAISLATGAGLPLDLPRDSFLSSGNGQYGASNDVLSSINEQYDARNDVLSSEGVGSMVSATMSYHREMGSMMPATTTYRRGMFCFPITQGWAAVRTLVLEGRNTQVRRVLRVRSCSCDPTVAGIRGSSCQRLSKGARGILM